MGEQREVCGAWYGETWSGTAQVPVCDKPAGHRGSHRTVSESGIRVWWGDLKQAAEDVEDMDNH